MSGKRYDTIISVDELKVLIRRESCRVIDCRFDLNDTTWGQDQYFEGHIPGAAYAHLDEHMSGVIIPGTTGRHPLPKFDEWSRQILQWGILNTDQVVLYDQHFGGFAARAWWLFRWVGHADVAVLDGGWNAWLAQGGEVSAEVPKAVPSSFKVSRSDFLAIDATEVDNWRRESDKVVVDSRDRARYIGEVEPIDPVAGHIPGAVNIPFRSNLRESGEWKSRDEIKNNFRPIEGLAPGHCVFYCGSGVTACHNILAYKHAGLGDALLYPGSWSEWITDPGRPVVKG